MNSPTVLDAHDHNLLTLRPGTKADLDNIVRIVCAGFPDDPEVDYRFPWRGQFPEDYVKWTRKEYEHYKEQAKKFVVHLVDTAVESEEGGKVMSQPVALAVWDIAVLMEAEGTGYVGSGIHVALRLSSGVFYIQRPSC
jgi:hypothetical protein